MLRSNLWLALAALSSSLAVQTAAAQTCTDDDVCGPGTHCVWDYGAGEDDPSTPSDSGDVAVSEPPTETCAPDDKECEGTSEPPPSGTCQPLSRGMCETQADCLDGLECVKWYESSPCTGGGATDAPAPVDGDEEPIVDLPVDTCDSAEPPVEGRYGSCVLPETTCETDDNCMLGLTCAATRGSSNSGDAEDQPVPAPEPDVDEAPADEIVAPEKPDGDPLPPEEETRTCVYQPPSCDNGEVCAAGYECVQIEIGSWCNGSEGCAPGEDCVPEEPECGTDYAKVCLPVQDPCVTDADCDANYRCMDFGGEDGLDAPEHWELAGPAKSCLPEGIALAESSGDGYGGGIEEDALGENGGKGEPTGNPQEPGDDDAGNGGSSSSCSVGTSGSPLASAWWLVAALGLVVRRRRAR